MNMMCPICGRQVPSVISKCLAVTYETPNWKTDWFDICKDCNAELEYRLGKVEAEFVRGKKRIEYVKR